jgi:hypothetical protein
MFDFIVSEMFFSLETDLNDLIGLMKVKNSFENDVFFAYTKFTNVVGKEAGGIEENLKKARETNDTAQTRILTERYRKISIDLQDYRKGVLEKHPQSLLAKIFKMMTEIQVPDAPRNAKGEIIDSNFQYNYYYQHFFDNIKSVIRTPDIMKSHTYISNIYQIILEQYLLLFEPLNNDVNLAGLSYV